MPLTSMSRRSALVAVLGTGLLARRGRAQDQGSTAPWSVAPLAWPDLIRGDGFAIGHGFACENTWFAPGWWHTGEDWYAIDRETAGAQVVAVAAGEVVYADFDYPGRVVIVQHEDELYSMYGHLDPDLRVQSGQAVEPGSVIGTVLQQAVAKGPGQAPSHLHFEVRTFLVRDDVNGSSPRYGVNCGFQCPPGPGYWPMDAAEHPADVGWRNPLMERLRRVDPAGLVLRANRGHSGPVATIRVDPNTSGAALGEITIDDSTALPLLAIATGDPASTGTSAGSYDAWYQVETTTGESGWIQGAIPSDRETGSDGRPSAVDLPFVIAQS